MSEPVTGKIAVRLAKESDIDDIMRIQSLCYPPEQLESYEMFSYILGHALLNCFVAVEEDYCIGFLLAHPWNDVLSPPELHHFNFEEMKHSNIWGSRIYYIHDLSVVPWKQKQGVGQLLVEALTKKINDHQSPEEGKPIVTLMSVGSSLRFWEKQGFVKVACDISTLESYKDVTAAYMLRH